MNPLRKKIMDRFGVAFSFSSFRITGWNAIKASEVVLIWHNSYRVDIGELSVRLRPLALLKRRNWPSSLAIIAHSVAIHTLGPAGEKTTKADPIDTKKSYSKKALHLYERFSRMIFGCPLDITLSNLTFAGKTPVSLHSFRLSGPQLSLTLGLGGQAVAFTGKIAHSEKEIHLTSSNGTSGGSFAAASIVLCFRETRTDVLGSHRVLLTARFDDLCINHRYISKEAYRSTNCSLTLFINLDAGKIEVGEGSSLSIDSLLIAFRVFYFQSAWPVVGSLWVIELDRAALEKLLPHFKNHLFCLGASARIKSTILFKINISDLQKQSVEISLRQDGFDFDSIDYSYIKEPFERIVHSPGFIPMDCLDPLFQKIIVLCEDPAFFRHAGVDGQFVGQAIVTNLQKRRIVRGASTITMQLSRNLFLSPEVSVMRKLEEVAIALMLEQIFRIPKEKILELYLNLIEFGPQVYGIKEACHFYFGKHPNELSLTEVIVLTYIIPRPIHFHEALVMRSQQLTVNLGRYLEDMLSKLLRNNLIQPPDRERAERKISFVNGLGAIDLTPEAHRAFPKNR